MLIISLFATLLISYLICSILNSALYFYAVAFACILLNMQLLSLFGGICAKNIVIVDLIFLVLTLLVWFKKGQPLLKPNFERFKEGLKKFINAFYLDKSLFLLVFGVLFILSVNFILSAFLPVNDFDALGYRGYRALSWAEAGKIFHFTTRDARNIAMPINSEIVYCWIYSLTGKDIGFGFLNFFTYIFTIFGINSLLKRLRFVLRKRIWAIGIYSSFAGILTQISSMQGDLIVGLFVLYSVIFIYDWIHSRDLKKAYFASLCAAVALGIKSTAFMIYLPLLPLVFVYFWKKSGQQEAIKDGAKFLGFLALNFAIFSSYNYILNFIDYNNPLGSTIILNRHGFFGGFKGFLANFITYNIQLVDFSGFTLGYFLTPFAFKIKEILFALFNIPPNTGVLIPFTGLNSSMSEQDIGFGITSLLTFFPCVWFSIFALVKFKEAKENRKILYALGALFYVWLVVLSFSIGYMPFSVRFMSAFVTVSSPVLVLCYRKKGFYKGFVLFFAMFYLLFASTAMSLRPFNSLGKAFKKEKNYAAFVYKTRCLDYPFFKGARLDCKINEWLFSSVQKGDKVGVFADENFLFHLVKIYAKEKGFKAEELLFTRFRDYNLREFDYLVAPKEFQTGEEYTKKDELKQIPKDCLFRINENNGKAVVLQCPTPYGKIEEQGFYKLKDNKFEWKNYTGENKQAEYVVFKRK